MTNKIFLVPMVLLMACVSHGRLLHPDDPAFARLAPAAFQVQLETSRGVILLEVRREWIFEKEFSEAGYDQKGAGDGLIFCVSARESLYLFLTPLATLLT